MKFDYLNVLQNEKNHQSDENVSKNPLSHACLLSVVLIVYKVEQRKDAFAKARTVSKSLRTHGVHRKNLKLENDRMPLGRLTRSA